MTTMSAIIHHHHQSRPLLPTISVSFHSVTVRNSVLNTNEKLANVQYLVQQYTMTALLETHVTGAKAELFLLSLC